MKTEIDYEIAACQWMIGNIMYGWNMVEMCAKNPDLNLIELPLSDFEKEMIKGLEEEVEYLIERKAILAGGGVCELSAMELQDLIHESSKKDLYNEDDLIQDN